MSKTLVIGAIAAVVGIFALGGFLLWQMSQMQTGLGPSSPGEKLRRFWGVARVGKIW